MMIYGGFLVEAVDAPHRLVHREPDRLGEYTGKGYRVSFSESGIVAVGNESFIKLLSLRVLQDAAPDENLLTKTEAGKLYRAERCSGCVDSDIDTRAWAFWFRTRSWRMDEISIFGVGTAGGDWPSRDEAGERL